jgi:hypothetical protein
MRLAARLISFAAVAGIVLAVLGGVVIGMRLGELRSEPAVQVLTIESPLGAQDTTPPHRSAGGFTGFEGAPALPGRAVRSGEVTRLGDTSFVVVSADGELNVATTAAARVFRVAPADRPLQPGDTVMLRIDTAGVAQSALRVVTPIEEEQTAVR